MESSEELVDAAPTPGTILRAAREQAGISVREMADRLNWMQSIVTAVEEDDFDALRGPAFVRGYLRAYARVVAVDEERVVAAYGALVPEHGSAKKSARSGNTEGSSQATGFSVAVGIGVAILFIAGVWWFQQDSAEPAAVKQPVPREQASRAQREQARSDIAMSASVQASTERALQAENLATEIAAAEALATQNQSSAAGDDTEGLATLPSVVSDEAGVPAAPDLASGAEVSRSETAAAGVEPALELAAGQSGLSFRFSADCWLEVRDANGQLIYADLRSAGDELNLQGQPPFSVLAGNAGALQVFYENEEFVIPVRPGRNSSQFRVGEF